MKYQTKILKIGASLVICSLFVGCSAGFQSKPVDYKDLPGSGDRMAEGPGLFKVGDGSDYDDGVRVYSSDPSHDALINSNRSRVSEQSDTTRPTAAEEATDAQRQNYRQFQEFEEYKRFQRMPRDSAEYQRFKDWQEWKRYQQWRDGKSAKP